MLVHWLLWLGCVFVLLLGGYGTYLWWRVWQQKQQTNTLRLHRTGQLMAQLAIMARAVETEQVNVTEGALRLSAMLQSIDETVAADVAVIHEMAEQALVLTIGEARKRLPRVEREQQDQQREALEQRYGPAVITAAKQLREALPADVISKLVATKA